MPPAPILYLTTSGQPGGAERCLLSLLAGLDRGRFTPEVLVGSSGPLLPWLSGAGVLAAELPLPTALRQLSRYHRNRPTTLAALIWQLPLYRARLRRAVALRRPALVHSNGMKMHALSAELPRRGPRLIWHLHDFPPRGRAPLRLLTRASRRVDAAIANSASVARAWSQRIPVLESGMRVIPNGVNVAALAAGDRHAQRRAWGLADNTLVIGMVAIFAPWKGQEVFLEAARQVLAQAPATRFVLAGEDIYDTAGHGGRRQELLQLARRLGIADAVIFPGYATDIAGAFGALDVAVHASTEPEPFGRTIIEAMAAGVAVVAADAGGVPEIITDGVSGCLTPPGDALALAGTLLQLIANPERRRALATAGRRRVEEQFSEAAVARQTQALYDELLAIAGHS